MNKHLLAVSSTALCLTPNQLMAHAQWMAHQHQGWLDWFISTGTQLLITAAALALPVIALQKWKARRLRGQEDQQNF